MGGVGLRPSNYLRSSMCMLGFIGSMSPKRDPVEDTRHLAIHSFFFLPCALTPFSFLLSLSYYA